MLSDNKVSTVGKPTKNFPSWSSRSLYQFFHSAIISPRNACFLVKNLPNAGLRGILIFLFLFVRLFFTRVYAFICLSNGNIDYGEEENYEGSYLEEKPDVFFLNFVTENIKKESSV